jgi:hypothetical protein
MFWYLGNGKWVIWEVWKWEAGYLGSCLYGKLGIWEVAKWEVGYLAKKLVIWEVGKLSIWEVGYLGIWEVGYGI